MAKYNWKKQKQKNKTKNNCLFGKRFIAHGEVDISSIFSAANTMTMEGVSAFMQNLMSRGLRPDTMLVHPSTFNAFREINNVRS